MSAFPGPEVELTTILIVRDVGRSRDFWRDVVGAEVYREYGGTSCVLDLAGPMSALRCYRPIRARETSR